MIDKPTIGVTLGDPAGIGPEIVAKAVTSEEIVAIARPLVIGDRKVLRQGLLTAKIAGHEIHPIKKIQEAIFTRGTIELFDLNNVNITKLKVGQVSKASGQASLDYVEKAIELARDGKIDAIATAPISKEAVQKVSAKFTGHTELLAVRTHTKNFAMMFVSEKLWVMLMTIHIPLQEVSSRLDRKEIVRKIKLAHEFLLKVKGKKPKIGVAGLNPHAGENGLFGTEDEKIIRPAVSEARKLGINVEGPLSADSLFHLASIGKYDLVIAMYHDQGLIPLKLLAFNHSVNVTVGLPIIRTSVDHGVGFDIAGRGWANASSLIEAIKVAAYFVKTR